MWEKILLGLLEKLFKIDLDDQADREKILKKLKKVKALLAKVKPILEKAEKQIAEWEAALEKTGG